MTESIGCLRNWTALVTREYGIYRNNDSVCFIQICFQLPHAMFTFFLPCILHLKFLLAKARPQPNRIGTFALFHILYGRVIGNIDNLLTNQHNICLRCRKKEKPERLNSSALILLGQRPLLKLTPYFAVKMRIFKRNIEPPEEELTAGKL
jgi:hypothetical protein